MRKVFVILFSLIYLFVFDVSIILSQIDDTTPPNLLTFDFNPKIVNVSQSFATVQFIGTAMDNLSGIRSGNFFFRLANGEPRSGGLQVQSVDNNGVATLVGTLGFPQSLESGTYVLIQLSLTDLADNTHIYDTNTLRSLGFPVEIVVTNNAQDTTYSQLFLSGYYLACLIDL